MNISEVKTTAWQISVKGQGEIAQGVYDINQCMRNILMTQKGTDPVDPDFGLDIMAWVDKPMNVVGPGMVPAIIDAIETYEPRVDLRKVNYTGTVTGQVVFTITWAYEEGMTYQAEAKEKVNKTYFLLSNEQGFILIDDNQVALLIN